MSDHDHIKELLASFLAGKPEVTHAHKALAYNAGDMMQLPPQPDNGWKEWHHDWNRLNALIQEMSFGNYATKAMMFYYCYNIIQRSLDAMSQVAEETNLPDPIAFNLELAAIEALREHLRRRAEGITKDQLQQCMSLMKEDSKPDKR